jgi:hypothetical protein
MSCSDGFHQNESETVNESDFRRPKSVIAKTCLVEDIADLSNFLLNSNRKKVVFNTCQIETLDKETGEKSVKKKVYFTKMA